jgi:hypothetical protein
VGFHQSDAVSTSDALGTSGLNPSDFTAWNIDFLLEKNLGWGTIDIEAAYFDYNNHGASGGVTGNPAAGQAWNVGFSYLYPEKIGWGAPQLVTRYVENDPTDADATTTQWTKNKLELGLHYIIDGHNAKIALVYSNSKLGGTSTDPDWNEDQSAIKLGMQFQH